MDKDLSAENFRGEHKLVEIDKIIQSRELQCREDLDEIKLMTPALAESVGKAEIDPVFLIEVPEGTNREVDGAPVMGGLYLVDGFRRTAGFKAAGRAKIPAVVRKGTWEDAVDVATSANIKNLAMPRKPADKRRAVFNSLVNHIERSDRWHSEHCKVGHDLPAKVRPEAEKYLKLHGKEPEAVGAKAVRIGKGGKKQAATKKTSAVKTEKRSDAKPRIAWEQWESHYGWVTRFIDSIGLAVGKDKTFQKIHTAWLSFGEDVLAWRGEIESASKEKS